MFFRYDSESRSFDITFQSEQWLKSAIISQLFTDLRSEGDEASKGDVNTGWWAESLAEFDTGSELYKIKQSKLTPEAIEMACQSVSNALKELQSRGVIELFDLLPEVTGAALILQIQVKPSNEPRMVHFGFRVPID